MVAPLIAAGARVAGKTALKGGSRGATAAARGSAKTLPQANAASRGVQNTQRFSTERPTVRSDFRESKSLQAKVARSLEARGKNKDDTTDFIQSSGGRNSAAASNQNTRKAFIERISGAAGRTKNVANVATSAPLLYWISGTLSFFIFFFGIACLAFIVMGESSLLGISIDNALSVASYVLTLGAGSFSLKELGLVCWVITLILSFMGHLGIALYAMLRFDIRFLDHQNLFLLTVLSIAGSILPVLQFVPWMVLWVAAIQAHAVLQSKKR